MRLHHLQHVPFEGLGSIETWAKAKGHALSATHVYRGEALPPVDVLDWLVVMGGPMSVHDEREHPWLIQEKRFIAHAIERGKTVVGVCLGAQLIAEVLGGRVFRNREKEIGWFPIRLTADAQGVPPFDDLPNPLTVFHWHGDTFDVPKGAVRVAESDGCANQAFVYRDRVMGLQCHLESTVENIRALIDQCADELVAGPYIQRPDDMLARPDRIRTMNEAMDNILDRLRLGTADKAG